MTCTKCNGTRRVPLYAGAGWAPCPRCYPRPSIAELGKSAGPGDTVVVDGESVSVLPIDDELHELAHTAGLTLDELLERAQAAMATGDEARLATCEAAS